MAACRRATTRLRRCLTGRAALARRYARRQRRRPRICLHKRRRLRGRNRRRLRPRRRLRRSHPLAGGCGCRRREQLTPRTRACASTGAGRGLRPRSRRGDGGRLGVDAQHQASRRPSDTGDVWSLLISHEKIAVGGDRNSVWLAHVRSQCSLDLRRDYVLEDLAALRICYEKHAAARVNGNTLRSIQSGDSRKR